MTVGRPRPTGEPPGAGDADDHLLTGACDGDRDCWERLVDGHLGSMWRAARATGASVATADVACRTVWLRLATGLGDGAPPVGEPLGEWLGRSVVAECRRYELTRSWSHAAGSAEVTS